MPHRGQRVEQIRTQQGIETLEHGVSYRGIRAPSARYAAFPGPRRGRSASGRARFLLRSAF